MVRHQSWININNTFYECCTLLIRLSKHIHSKGSNAFGKAEMVVISINHPKHFQKNISNSTITSHFSGVLSRWLHIRGRSPHCQNQTRAVDAGSDEIQQEARYTTGDPIGREQYGPRSGCGLPEWESQQQRKWPSPFLFLFLLVLLPTSLPSRLWWYLKTSPTASRPAWPHLQFCCPPWPRLGDWGGGGGGGEGVTLAFKQY